MQSERAAARGCRAREARVRTGRGMRLRWGRDALEGKGPQRGPQRRLDRRLEEVAKAVGGGYCRLQMALGVRERLAGRRLGAVEGGYLPPFQCISVGKGGPKALANAVARGWSGGWGTRAGGYETVGVRPLSP